MLCNLTATISDHLPQFAIVPNMFGNTLGNKSNIHERDWSKFDRENLTLYYFSVDFINKKAPILKGEFHTKYKKYRNLFSTLMKRRKLAYYDKHFERN